MATPPHPHKPEVTLVATVDSPQDEAASNVKPVHEAPFPSGATGDDLMTILPPEIALHLFMFMDSKDLLSLAQTCHILRFQIEDEKLWEAKCKEATLQYCLDSSEEDLLGHRSTMNSSLQEILKRLSRNEASFEFSKWKANFIKGNRVEMYFRENPIRRPIELDVLDVNENISSSYLVSLEFVGDKIVARSSSHKVKVWDPFTGNCFNLEGHTGVVRTIQVEDHIIISGSLDTSLKVWDANNGQCLRTLEGPSGVWSSHLYEGILVAGFCYGFCYLYNVNEGTRLNIFMGHDDHVACVQYNGRLVASGSLDNTVKIWSPETAECLHTFVGHTGLVSGVLFAGDHVVSSSLLDRSIRVWDVEEATCKHRFEEYETAFDWNNIKLRGNTLVSSHANSVVKIWDTRTWECLRVIDDDINKHSRVVLGQFRVSRVVDALDFNDKFVVTCSGDGKVKLWDLKTGDFIRDLLVLEEHGYVEGQVNNIKMKDAMIACSIRGNKAGNFNKAILVLNFGNVL